MDGPEAIRERLRRDLDNARWFAEQVALADAWEVLAPVSLQTVCIRHTPEEETGQPLTAEALDVHTLAWVERVNASGAAFLSPSLLDGRWMVRVSIGVEGTTREHVAALWALLQEVVTG
jgi:glutamate/tyrosine decarboxylase-like PLP-dependent enzyme